MTSPGEVLNGRYRLEKRLGEGAMGSVWRAYDPVLERLVAVKELITNRSGGEPLEIRLERVRREALALAKIEHPAVVTIHDLIYVRSAEDPWIVMGYAHGRSLDKIIVADGRLGEQQVAAIGLAVFEGLEACHKHRVYHRDVKPANIVVGEDGSARLVDFGIVRMVGKEALTATSNVLGTPEFLAPEMVDKQPKVGPTTDMWALAVTLYCALEGKSPFWAESINAIFAAIAAKSPPEPRDGGPLAELVVQMLRKQPRDRPDAATVKSVLRDIAGLDSPRGGPSPREQNRTADRNGWAGHVPPQPSAGYRQETQLVHTEHRRAPLHGLPPVHAAKEIARLPPEQAVVRLLALGEPDAANIFHRRGRRPRPEADGRRGAHHGQVRRSDHRRGPVRDGPGQGRRGRAHDGRGTRRRGAPPGRPAQSRPRRAVYRAPRQAPGPAQPVARTVPRRGDEAALECACRVRA